MAGLVERDRWSVLLSAMDLPEFTWIEDYACGVDLIDRQHRTLIDLTNLLRSIILREDAASIAYCLVSLKAYVVYHFAYEESWARAHGMPEAELARHARSHHAFGERVRLLADTRPPADGALRSLHGFLSSWLVKHIIQEDRDMVRRLQAGHGADAG